MVSAGESGAGHVQLPDDSHRHGLEVPVEDQSGKADGRSSDVDVLARPHGFTDAGLDGGFGGSVSVEHATVAAPDVHEFGWAASPPTASTRSSGSAELSIELSAVGVMNACETCSSAKISANSDPPKTVGGMTTRHAPLPNAIMSSKTEASKLGDAR